MGFRNIVIENNVCVSVKKEQLLIDNYMIPLEDINSIMIENREVSLNAYFISKIGEYGIACYVCDSKHCPSTVILPIASHSRHFLMLNHQIHISPVVQKRLWKDIVKRKIYNQALDI